MPIALLLLLCGFESPVWGQPGFVPFRPPVFVPPRPPFIPPTLPAFSQDQSRDSKAATAVPSPNANNNEMEWIFPCVVLVVVIGGLVVIAFRGGRSEPERSIRILAIPPGEAPEAVRAAWVGLELPLSSGYTQPQTVPGIGVASGLPTGHLRGYLVEGREAVACLAAASPEAAAWWRTYAAHVLAPGYQLVFPVEICHRVGDAAPVWAACSASFICHPDGTVEDARRFNWTVGKRGFRGFGPGVDTHGD
jgi:hypothetical protein